MNVELLERKMKEKNITIPKMAADIGIDISTWYRKIKDPSDGKFLIGEAEKIIAILDLTEKEACHIFFAS